MNFPQFWARGSSGNFFTWRWSSTSLTEAQSLANEAAQQLMERFKSGVYPPKGGGYYPNRPFREQIMQQVKAGDGTTAAVVTRNSYGCLVLNTARVMFVDIDFPEPRAPRRGLFSLLFGKKPEPTPPPPSNAQNDALAKIELWTRNRSDWGWRIYRTRAGLRLMATHALFDADSSTAKDVFESLGADPLYRKLCTSQKCYRARLTPKPWRCEIYSKPERWPWLDERQEKKFQKWDAQYQASSANWATCELIREIGNNHVHPEIKPIVELHDKATRVGSKLQLA